jgi:hypothetical protein
MHWNAYERVTAKVSLPLHEDPIFHARGLMWGNPAGVQAVIDHHDMDLEETAVVRELATRIPYGWRLGARDGDLSRDLTPRHPA